MVIDLQYRIELAQVFRYLGYKADNYPPELVAAVEEAIEEFKPAIIPQAQIEEFNLIADKDQMRLRLPGGQFLSDRRLFEMLQKSKAVVMAVLTLGKGFAAKTLAGGEKSGLAEIIKDAIGTAVLNDASMQLRKILDDKYNKEGFTLTKRLSPGENGISLDVQGQIFALLNPRELGVTLNRHMMMEPLKTYSMLFGIVRSKEATDDIFCTQEAGCAECGLESCAFREAGPLLKVTVMDKDKEKIVFARPGENLFELLIKNGFKVVNSCGGKHTCGKCLVRVEADSPIAIKESEKKLLRQQADSAGRLACFVEVEQDLRIYIPQEAPAQICVQSLGKPHRLDPRLNRVALAKSYGIAVDIGTTTVAVYLVNLRQGEILDNVSFLNPQRTYGADVITRIEYSLKVENGLEQLNREIIGALNSAVAELCKRNSIKPDEIYEMVVAGNTTMLYLVLGLNCTNLGQAPYSPVYTAATKIASADLGLELNTDANTVILPGIAAFVGADTLAGLGACGMHEDETINLLIDLGTNGEVVLGNKDRMLSCSTAAGPAFEGGRITFGVGGVNGAIDHVDFGWDKLYTTINNQDPVGICGSGVLDIAAELLRSGIIDKSGRMRKRPELDGLLAKDLTERVIDQEGQTAFLLDKARRIVFTQKDIRELQLAKGAISAGIMLLLKELNIQTGDIGKVYVAGGFGNYMNIASAVALKLIPADLQHKTVSIGNGAGNGAVMALKSDAFYQSLKQAQSKVEYVELSLLPQFQTEYLKALDF